LAPEIIALLVLLGGVVTAVVFTIVIVVTVKPSNAEREETGQEREGGSSQRT
jgi:hypothetical protein